MSNPYDAYNKTRQITSSGAEKDAEILEKMALLLIELQKDTSQNWSDILLKNQSLWTQIQAEIGQTILPNEIKANIMSLSIFVDKQTWKIFNYKESERSPSHLDTLININMNIAMGLRGDIGY